MLFVSLEVSGAGRSEQDGEGCKKENQEVVDTY
jgi:hypothetical protein